MSDDPPENPYLELLVRGAPAEAYERPVLRARADRAPADRLGWLLGPDWQSPARSLEIQLALRLHRLASAVAY
ncbi:hypothetical protein ACH4VS_31875 [Streptomyces hygroscopicus]|nr:hypothetical protein Shyhy02_57850 [Streptomyces hygroscopicus subsp. hygroscopicus]